MKLKQNLNETEMKQFQYCFISAEIKR